MPTKSGSWWSPPERRLASDERLERFQEQVRVDAERDALVRQMMQTREVDMGEETVVGDPVARNPQFSAAPGMASVQLGQAMQQPQGQFTGPVWSPPAIAGLAQGGRMAVEGLGKLTNEYAARKLSNERASARASTPVLPTRQGGQARASMPSLRQPPTGWEQRTQHTVGQPKSPAYNYHIEMLKAADAGDAYARDFNNLREQARQAAAQAAARGEKFVFVPLKDYRNNTMHFINANGSDAVLDLNDEDDKAELQRMANKHGISPIEVQQWAHRSSRPLLAYDRPSNNIGETTPDFSRWGAPQQQGTVPSLPSRQAPSLRSLDQGASPPTQLEQRPAPAMPWSPPAPTPQSEGVADFLNRTNANEPEKMRRMGRWDWDREQPVARQGTAAEFAGATPVDQMARDWELRQMGLQPMGALDDPEAPPAWTRGREFSERMR